MFPIAELNNSLEYEYSLHKKLERGRVKPHWSHRLGDDEVELRVNFGEKHITRPVDLSESADPGAPQGLQHSDSDSEEDYIYDPNF